MLAVATTWLSLTPTDWGTLAAALFTAVAAVAAATTVIVDLRRQHTATMPHLSAAFNSVLGEDPHQKMELANVGPGIAIGSAHFGVEGGVKFGGFFAKSNLLPGERSMVRFPAGFAGGSHVSFIWWCRDLGGRLHLWSHHGGYKQLRPRPDDWPSERELFNVMYPDDAVPGGDILTFPTE